MATITSKFIKSSTTAGQVLTSNGTGTSASWQAVPSSPTTTYWSGYTNNAASWSTTSSTLVDGTNSGGNTLTTRHSNGITVTAAASNVAGITFTPAASTSIYMISAVVQVQASASNNQCSYSLTDGSTVIQQTSRLGPLISSAEVITFSGIFAPGTGSSVTVKLQIATSTGTAYIMALGTSIATPVIEWTVVQIK